MTFRELAESKGFTPTTLSRASGVEHRSVTRYFSGMGGGISVAYPYNRKAIAKALGMKEKDMLEALK